MKHKHKKKPLRFYLATGFLIFSALLLIVLWMFQTVFLESFYKTVKTNQVKNCAYAVSDHINSDDLSDLVAEIEDQNNMSVGIYNTTEKFFKAVYLTKNRPDLHSMVGMDVAYELYDKAKDNNGEYSRIAQMTNEHKQKRFFNNSAMNNADENSGNGFAPLENGDNGNGSNPPPANSGEGFIPNDNGFAPDNSGQGTQPSESKDNQENGEPGEKNGSQNSGNNGDQPADNAAQPNNSNNHNNQISEQPAADGSVRTSAVFTAAAATEATEAATGQSTENDRVDSNTDQQENEFNDVFREPSLERKAVDSLAFAKIVTSGDCEYLVIIESEITPVASVVDTLRFQLIIMTAVIVVLSVVMAIIVAKVISKPISDATEKAKQLADQNYDVTFSGGRYREITELNNTLAYAAQELKKVDSLQKELIANISHDLRTPLTMITGYAEIMRDLPGEATPENVQIIIDEANRLNDLVTDLLDISRLRSGTAGLKLVPFSLTNCIKNTFARYQKLVENEGLNIVFEHDCEVFVKGDELRMTQVLYNLVNNAVNYIGEDKTVIVRQTVSDGMVKIEVIDHGAGIPQDKLDYIWDRYYRVDKEHQRAIIGTGLGLSIVKNILLAHDADFGVASKLGSGSDFYFSLPVIDVEEEKE